MKMTMKPSTMRVVGIAFVACVLLLASWTAVVAAALVRPPSFVLDLDKPPLHRWDGAVGAVVSRHGWWNSIGAVYKKYEPRFALMPPFLVSILEGIVQDRFPNEYQELLGLCQQMINAATAAGVPNATQYNVTTMLPWVFFYEFGDLSTSEYHKMSTLTEESFWRDMKRFQAHGGDADGKAHRRHVARAVAARTERHAFPRACTGILSLPQLDATADTIHGRNMDEQPKEGRNCTLNITVTKGGQVLYHIFDWMWMTTGFFTGSRRNAVTLEMNWRDHSQINLLEIMARLMTPTTMPTLWMYRTILEQGLDFESAVSNLNTTVFAAPFYAIMSGTGRRGAVITTFFNNSDNVIDFVNDASEKPYMVQTNYDRWLPDPPSDPRRTVAEDTLAMELPSRAGSLLGVWMAASVFPVHNQDTMYTVLLSVSAPPEGYIRTDMIPDKKK